MADRRPRRISSEEWRSARRIFGFLRPYRAYFIGGLILLGLSSLTFLTIMVTIGEAADAAGGNDHVPAHFTVSDYIWFFVVLLGVQGVVSYVRIRWFAIATERGLADLRKQLYRTLIGQPLAFFEENRPGELSSRLTADVDQLQTTFSTTLAEFLRQVILLVGGLIYIFYLVPRLSLVMLAVVPLAVGLAFVLGLRMRRFSARRQKALAASNIIVEESFQLFRTVKAYVNEAFEERRFGRAIDDLVDEALALARFKGLFASFIIVAMFGGILFILFRGLLMVEDPDNPMTLAQLTTFIFFTGTVGGAIASLANHYTTIASALGATKRVQDVLDMETEVHPEEADGIAPLTFERDIVVDGLRFAYPTRPDTEVLHGVDLRIEHGQQVALVGPSGSGKSTLVKLIGGLYGDFTGDIRIDGRSIRSIDPVALRKAVGVVPQDVVLFGTTIGENIRYGRPDASDAAVRDAADRANALEFIDRFPDGFDTAVGDRGVQLSGGQKQRVAIARAILKDPSILVLDEATSSLDSASEQLVQEALDRLMEGRTAIVIAHRLSTIRHADRIVVLQRGSIIETGSHDELIAREEGHYRHLIRLQFDGGLA